MSCPAAHASAGYGGHGLVSKHRIRGQLRVLNCPVSDVTLAYRFAVHL